MMASRAASSVEAGSGRWVRKDFEAECPRSLMCRRTLGVGRFGGWLRSLESAGWVFAFDGVFGTAEGRVVSVMVDDRVSTVEGLWW